MMGTTNKLVCPFGSWRGDACNLHEGEGYTEEHDGLAQAPGLMGLPHKEDWVARRAQQNG